MTDLFSTISQRLLPRIQGPAQYAGGEVNQIRKDPGSVDISVVLAYPDAYTIGMSHLGLAILYTALNQMEGVVAERTYAPWLDVRSVMRSEGIPLYSWESRRPVREFDVLGITLQHELIYSNVLYLLDLAGISFRAADRQEDEPLVIGGGPMSDCCEPVADFFDLVILGDGEESLPMVVQAIRVLKKTAARRHDILLELARRFEFVYVPQFYEVSYCPDGTLAEVKPNVEGVPACVQRAAVADMDGAVFPTAPIIPYAETPHDRIAIEIMRGCPQRCAFCHAGHTRGKLRFRSLEKIVELAWESYLNTGHDTISLLSLSSSDYPRLAQLVQALYGRFEGCHMGISLPSLRVDRQLRDIPEQITGTRREGLTIAVEAATDILRKAIGKRVTDHDLMATVRNAFEVGWKRVKLYFMAGFPYEISEDIDGIVELAGQISRLGKEVRGTPAAVHAAVSWLVPKPHTPFGWMAMQPFDYFMATRRRLIDQVKSMRKVSIKLKFHYMERSILEGVLARGDRRLSGVIEKAYRNGAHFDSWDETFQYDRYLKAFQECGIDPAFYAHRERGETEVLPWDHLAGDNRVSLYQRHLKIRDILTNRPVSEREP